MIRIEPRAPFQAVWNPLQAHLNRDSQSLLQKVVYTIKKVVLFVPNSVVAACINPRRATPFSPFIDLEEGHGEFRKKIITPDRVDLAATVHIVEGAVRETPTVILFNPLGTNQGIHSQGIGPDRGGIEGALIACGCNVITFDYRGLGSTWQAEDLVVDGESIYQYATDELGIDPAQVHFYGFSLGGAISLQVKALHPEVESKYVGDRSFKSVFSWITEKFCIARLGWLIKKITMAVSAIFVAYPVYFLGWEWNGSQIVDLVGGEKRFIYHPQDDLLPFEGCLADGRPEEELIRLNEEEVVPSTHGAPLGYYNTPQEGRSPAQLVADFFGSRD
ncbi:MAG: alpha/beta hydrolase [Chlamydiales bacterium]|nr:alpha/beta hydrolase [Chlamydiales bacterium]